MFKYLSKRNIYSQLSKLTLASHALPSSFISSVPRIEKFHTLISPLLQNTTNNFIDSDINSSMISTTTTTQVEKTMKRIIELNNLLDFNPTMTDALIERSNCYIEQCEWKLACNDLEKVLELESHQDDIISLYERLYWLYTRQDNYNLPLAAKYLERVFTSLDEVEFKYYFELVSIYFEMGEYDRAILYATMGIEAITKKNQSNTDDIDNLSLLLSFRGYLLIITDKIKDGSNDLERALNFPNVQVIKFAMYSYIHLQNHYQLIKTYELLKQVEKLDTRTTTDENILLDEYNQLHKIMQNYFYKEKDYKKTMDCMKNYYNRDETDYAMYVHLCIIVGDYNEFMSSMSLYGMNVDILEHDRPTIDQSSISHLILFTTSLSAAFYYSDRFDHAIIECEKLKELIEIPQEIYPKEHLLGIYYLISTYSHLKKGNDEIVYEFVSKAQKYHPLIRRFVAEYFFENGNYNMSRKIYLDNYNETKDLENLANIADCYIKEKDFEKAITECEKILNIDPQCMAAYFNLGETYFNLGDLERAKHNFDIVLNCTKDETLLKSLHEIWPSILNKYGTLI